MRNKKWMKALAVTLCLTAGVGNTVYANPGEEQNLMMQEGAQNLTVQEDAAESTFEETDEEEADLPDSGTEEERQEVPEVFSEETKQETEELRSGDGTDVNEESQEMEPDEGMTEKEFQAQVPVVTEIQAMDYQTVQLSWDEVEEAQGYSGYRRVKGTEGWKWYAKALTNSYVDEKAQTGVRYEYTVRGFCQGESERIFTQYGNTMSAVTKLEIVDFTAKPLNYCSVQLSWEKTAGATQYDVFRRTSSSETWKWLKRVSANTLKYVDKTAQTGVNYYYTVRAQRVTSQRRVVGKYRTDVRAKAVLNTPGIGAKVNDDQIRVTWGKVAGADGYHITRKVGDGQFEWYCNRTSLYLDDKNVEQTKAYTYRIAAYRYVNGRKVWSEKRASSQIVVPPDKPVVTVASKSKSAVQLKWTKNSKADFFYVYRLDNGKWSRIGTVKAGTYQYKDTTVKRGKTYKYRVRAGAKVNGKNYYSVYGQSKECKI